ncbi:MAG TPA: hypothetical protein VGB69_11525 [Edaphobacter sp.]
MPGVSIATASIGSEPQANSSRARASSRLIFGRLIRAEIRRAFAGLGCEGFRLRRR